MPAGVAALVGLPYLSYAAKVEPADGRARRVHRISRDRLRHRRGADAGAGRRHPGARRAALPVAQGDHGRPQQGDRDPLAGRPRRSTARPSVERPRRTRLVDSRPPPPGPRRASSRRRPRRPPERSSASWPSGGSSDGGRRSGSSARPPTRAGEDQRGGGDARPRPRDAPREVRPGIVTGADPTAAADALAAFVPEVLALAAPAAAGHALVPGRRAGGRGADREGVAGVRAHRRHAGWPRPGRHAQRAPRLGRPRPTRRASAGPMAGRSSRCPRSAGGC